MTTVSIITTCFNRNSTIGEVIESVLSQDYPAIEYIVVDGASSDGSVDIINQYKDKITTFISEKDNGMYEAINKGIRMAKGDLIGLLHSDDTFYDNHVVSRIVERFEQTGCDFIYGNGLFVDQDNTAKVVRDWIGGGYKKWKIRWGWHPLHPTCYIRRSVIEQKGLYDEKYKIASDTDFLVRYLKDGDLKVEYLKEYIVKMRMGGLSTDKKRRDQVWKEDTQIYHHYGFHGHIIKMFKMAWKIPQFLRPKVKRYHLS